jgi:hypothetical protein
MIVVDVGCAPWGGDVSVPHLLEEFHPKVLYGFDPGLPERSNYFTEDGTEVILAREAAWTFDGTIGFRVGGLGGQVDEHALKYPCVDLAGFINGLAEDEIVLKIDAEGAEYTLIPHLRAKDADLRLKLCRIEWHCEFCGIGGNGRHREECTVDRDWWIERRERTEQMLRCPTDEWNL